MQHVLPAAHGIFHSSVPNHCLLCVLRVQEAKIALVRLYQNQTYKLLPGQVPLALQQNITLSPRNGVRVRVVPRA